MPMCQPRPQPPLWLVNKTNHDKRCFKLAFTLQKFILLTLVPYERIHGVCATHEAQSKV